MTSSGVPSALRPTAMSRMCPGQTSMVGNGGYGRAGEAKRALHILAALVALRIGHCAYLREIPWTCFRTTRGTVTRQILGRIVGVEFSPIDGGLREEIHRERMGLQQL